MQAWIIRIFSIYPSIPDFYYKNITILLHHLAHSIFTAQRFWVVHSFTVSWESRITKRRWRSSLLTGAKVVDKCRLPAEQRRRVWPASGRKVSRFRCLARKWRKWPPRIRSWSSRRTWGQRAKFEAGRHPATAPSGGCTAPATCSTGRGVCRLPPATGSSSSAGAGTRKCSRRRQMPPAARTAPIKVLKEVNRK